MRKFYDKFSSSAQQLWCEWSKSFTHLLFSATIRIHVITTAYSHNLQVVISRRGSARTGATIYNKSLRRPSSDRLRIW